MAAASGGSYLAILLYEAALGLGISLGPLLGAALGDMSWRYPFYGTATLMAIGFILAVLIPPIRDFFALQTFNGDMLLAWAAGSAIGLTLMAITLKIIGRDNPRGAR